MPSVLRMNRTSAEFAMSAIFDGLLKAAINFTDVHAPSRIACIEENLIEYLVQDLIPLLRNIRWGKVSKPKVHCINNEVFPLRIYLVNVTKFAVFCEFGHIY